MNAIETRKAIQSLLGVTPDGQIGPKTLQALNQLVGTPDDSLWPPAQVSASAAGTAEMSETFTDFIGFIFEWEGEAFENDPQDPGGATKFGIDQRSHPGVDIRNLTKEQATAIYWSEWIRDRCDVMASPMAEVFFNCAVNMGLGRAQEFAQGNPMDASIFLDRQEAYYRKLGASAQFSKYLHGWLNRTEALRKRFNL